MINEIIAIVMIMTRNYDLMSSLTLEGHPRTNIDGDEDEDDEDDEDDGDRDDNDDEL